VVEVDRIKRRCTEFSVSLAAAAIQFAAAHPAVVSVCLGASSVAQQQQNFISAAEVIPADFWTALRADGVIQDWAPTPA
jgi:D-threo-aldose 1-dehydrogenase